MQWLRRPSVKKKLLTAYIPLIILPIVAISIASYALLSYEMKQASFRYANQTVEQINRSLETYLQELERLSLFPYFHSEVMDILRDPHPSETPDAIFQKYKFFNDMFNNIMLNPREDLLNVFLYQKDGPRYFNTRVQVYLDPNYDWESSDWYRRTLDASGDAVYLSNSGKDGRFTSLSFDMFSVSRLIKTDNGKVLGAILIDANFQGITNILRDIGLGDPSNVVLRDDRGTILFAQNGLFLEDMSSSDTLKTRQLIIGNEHLVVANYRSQKTGWTISAIMPTGDIYQSLQAMRNLSLWISVIFGLLTIVVTIWLAGGITRPIREMYRMMKKVENGNYNVEISVDSQDEIGALSRAFNQMKQRINELIHEVYLYNYRQKEAELNNLKTQIRPHFLYNTLEAVRALAEIKDNRDIVEITEALGSILRYSIRTHEKLVLLYKEVEYVRQYVKIHQIMMEDSIQVHYDIDPSILGYYSIPLLLQPIIENTFQHGLYGKRDGILSISGKREGDHLRFIISDNGGGIEADRIRELNDALRQEQSFSPDDSDKGIGLRNVNQRIRIIFGHEYGIRLMNNVEGGTSVHLRIPVIYNENQELKAGE